MPDVPRALPLLRVLAQTFFFFGGGGGSSHTLFGRHTSQDMIGVLQRKTVNMLQQAGEMGKLEREPIVDADVKDRLR